MTISYTLDVSRKSSWVAFVKVLSRWRGSVWKAVLDQLALWTACYLLISLLYRHLLSTQQQEAFEAVAHYLGTGLDSTIPLTFMLGFFVTQVVSRWSSILNGLGWIDNSAMAFATYIRGTDQDTRMLRRNLVRYMVLNQALVLRDISMQVRKRFPTLDCLVAAGLLTKSELEALDQCHDHYARYWMPIHWCYQLVYEARLHGKIASDYLLDKITFEIQHFRHGLASLLKYDWVPIPLLYPQVVFLSVRIYFLLCLISRQFITRPGAKHQSEIDLWLPIGTMIQFLVYVGWMKVAEALLNPLGEDDDDLESCYVIDKNLITGLTLVDLASKRAPEQSKDVFWDNDHIAPLYSLDAAKRTVHPMVGSASMINLVRNVKNVTMAPHKSKLSKMDEQMQQAHIRVVDVERHNIKHASEMRLEKKGGSEDAALSKIRRRNGGSGGGKGGKTGGGAASANGAPTSPTRHANVAPVEAPPHQMSPAAEHRQIHQQPQPHYAQPQSPHRQLSDGRSGASSLIGGGGRGGGAHQQPVEFHPIGGRQPDPLSPGLYLGEERPQRDYSPYMGHVRRMDESADTNGRGSGTIGGSGLRRY